LRGAGSFGFLFIAHFIAHLIECSGFLQ